MSLAEYRGGVPKILQYDITTTGGKYEIRQITKYMQVMTATNPVKIFFTENDYTNDQNYIQVPVAVATHPWGWEGPVEATDIWLKGVGGTASVTVVAYLRRG